MKKNQRGFTMGEVLLVTSLLSFATTGVMTLVSKKTKVNNGEQYYRQMVMDGRGTVDQIAKELRQAGLPKGADNAEITFANSNKVAATTFLVANSEQIVFEADLDNNGVVERIEYRLKGESLERGVVSKKADGSVPPVNYEVVAQRVDNGGLPVFTFDGDLRGDQPVAADPQQVRVMLLLRSPVRDRKSGRARTVGFEAVAERRVAAPVETASIETPVVPTPEVSPTLDEAATPAATAPASIEASAPEAAPATQPADVAVSAPEPAAVPTAKLFTPIPTGLGMQPSNSFHRIRFPRHLDLPAMFPAGVVIATTAAPVPEAL